MILRPYQIKAREDILSAYESGSHRVCLQLPTGSGKTCIFTDIADKAKASETRTVIIVHRDTLLLQASRKLNECGVMHGIIAPGLPRTRDLIQVASIQTLIRRDNSWDFIIIDESHHALAPSYLKILERNPDAHVLGVTATPQRTNGEGLNKIFDTLICGPSITELIAEGFLVQPKVYGPQHKLDLSSVRTRMGDYDQQQLVEAMDRPTITGSAVLEYGRLCAGKPAVAFTVSIQHAIDVSAEFNTAGYRAEFVSGKMHLGEIRSKIAGLSNGSIQVLSACDLISEGFDCPAVGAAILLRPTKSLTVYLQQCGRVLRPYSGKNHAIILDHAGSYLHHGMPDDDREWSLEGRKKKPGAAPVRQCERCFAAFRPAPTCPQCGYVFPIVDRAREVEHVDGELKEIDPAEVRRARQEEEHAARTYADLKAIAKRRGYRPQWAWYAAVRRGIPV